MQRVTEISFYALVRAFKDFSEIHGACQGLRKTFGAASSTSPAGRTVLVPFRSTSSDRRSIQGYLDGWDDKPGKQAAALAAFKALERWAVVRDLLPQPITLGVETGTPARRPRRRGPMPRSTLAEKYARPDLSPRNHARGQHRTTDQRPGAYGARPISKPTAALTASTSGRKRPAEQVWVPILAPLAHGNEDVGASARSIPATRRMASRGRSAYLTDRLDL